MGIIHVLDSEISNKIAAGEVVERPASVIKELVENSIDAGAEHISVEIEKGGGVYMRVSDNGCGMSADDARICFLRHATSKISKSEDLGAIYTLGFRGEALSSIGAVSRAELSTKRASDETGITVTCEGGEILSSDEAGIPDGTSVTVRDLFFNTPARLKFLKKDATEAGYITDIMTRFIFSHPEISFRLIIDGKEKLFSPGDSSLKNAVYTAYGKDYANGTIPIEYENGAVKVTGLIGKGTLARPKRNYQSFFVNGRYINSRTITAALENAYKNQIMIGKFPMAVLNISIDPSNIDINVHPTKTEVKFSDEKAVYDAVYYGVRGALYAIPNVPKIERAADEPVKIERDASKQLTLTDMVNALPRGAAQNRNNSFSDYFAGEKGKGKKSFSPSDAERSFDFGDRAEEINDNTAERAQNIPNAIHEDKIPKTLSVSSPKRKEEPLIPSRDGTPNENAGKAAAETTVFEDEYFEIIGQIFNTYIIAEKGDEMMIIDQHAAHERLKYEELLRELDSRSPFSQMLIEPVVVNLSASEMAAYRKNKKLFDETGFESEEFGGDSVIIRYAPGEIEMGEVEPLFSELVAQSEDMKHELIGDKYQRILYTIACKSAVKANMRMSVQEMESLVRNVLRLKNINTCPHGRPIIITMSKKEIEKEFKRIV